MGERLKYLPTQDSLVLLHHSLAIPRVLYNLRSSPCFLSPKLKVYDILFKSITSNITNIALVKMTLHGFRSLEVFGSGLQCSWHHLPFWLLHWSDALAKWSYGHDLSPPHGTTQQRQRARDTLKVSVTVNTLFEVDSDKQIMSMVSGSIIKGVWCMHGCILFQYRLLA